MVMALQNVLLNDGSRVYVRHMSQHVKQYLFFEGGLFLKM